MNAECGSRIAEYFGGLSLSGPGLRRWFTCLRSVIQSELFYEKINQAGHIIQGESMNLQLNRNVAHNGHHIIITAAERFIMNSGSENFNFRPVLFLIPLCEDDVHMGEKFLQFIWVVIVVDIHHHADLVGG